VSIYRLVIGDISTRKKKVLKCRDYVQKLNVGKPLDVKWSQHQAATILKGTVKGIAAELRMLSMFRNVLQCPCDSHS
jgi:hypothetical protein